MAIPYPAKSLVKLQKQLNVLAPNRAKPDGWIGDKKHRARKSDHNPNSKGAVRAMDYKHDPANGFDSYKFAETLRQNRDPRILNVISAGKIFSSEVQPWVWRKYVGADSHHQHAHVSVSTREALYDDASTWNLGSGPIATSPTSATPGTLWRGAKGPEVRDLQVRLGIGADGDFGRTTEKAVKEFQKSKGLTVDGVVGMNTWLALLTALPSVLIPPQKGIVATMFGGAADKERSAYDNQFLGDTEFYASLPYRFKSPPLLKVTNTKNNKSALVRVRDVGPWYIDDPYWAYGRRPQAEVVKIIERGVNKGRKSNHAGIDLSPAAAKAIGITGDPKTDRVDWEQVEAV